MLKQITGTIGARIITTAMGLLVSVVAGHRLGVEGIGVIGLIALGITLVGLLAGAFGGGVMVYMVPRVPLARLVPHAYVWAVVLSVVGYAIVKYAHLVPEGYAEHVGVLAFLQSGYSIHTGVLLGQQRVRAYNYVDMLRSVLLLGVFALLAFRPSPTPLDYVHAAYGAFGISLLASAFATRNSPAPAMAAPADVWRTMAGQGLMVQGANGLQLVLYRVSYWLIEHYRNTSLLGLYVVANQLSEGAWLVPRSVAVVLYSKVSNTESTEGQKRVTIDMLKLSVSCALLALVALLLIPEALFSWVFGPEVFGLRPIIAMLAPGILGLAASQAFSHYFSGTAQNKHNVIGSGIGLLAMLAAGFTLIPAFGLLGAAASGSLAYLAAGIYQALAFMRVTGAGFSELLPSTTDAQRLQALLANRRNP
ncbi:MAG: polysaccharide biosynthesis C-terminal domain-containing protein [Flavobacteriales bacterium]|nr:polysaccharide biosynthesis C-terminal domain-containing protein [Flavobacteriales bacterium]